MLIIGREENSDLTRFINRVASPTILTKSRPQLREAEAMPTSALDLVMEGVTLEAGGVKVPLATKDLAETKD